MAAHIQSIAGSSIPKVSKADFYSALRFGDAVFCEGHYPVSRAIEAETGSPLSHILTAWLPPHADVWLTAEATLQKGVHVGLLSDYVEKYNGDLAIVRVKGLSEPERYAMMNAFFAVLDDTYNAGEEITTALHKLLPCIPVKQPQGELYCSQLWKVMRAATHLPCGLGADGVNYTPEDAWIDSTMEPVAALLNPR